MIVESRAQQSLGTRPPGLPDRIRHRPEWERLRRQIYERAIRFDDQLSFDFRELLTDASNLRDAGALMWQLVRRFEPEVLIGPGFGATPLLYATALAALAEGVNLQVLMVRDRRKDHNQKRWVEGHRQSAMSKRAVMIDDFMQAGSALPLVRKALAADKVSLDISAVALFYDMWEPLGSRQISVSQCPVVSLYSRHDVGLSRDSFDAVPPSMAGAAPALIGDSPRWWRFALNRDTGYPTKSAPAISRDSVFVVDDRSQLWRHDLQTGEVQWCVESLAEPYKGVVQLLQVIEGDVVFGCYDGTVTRVDGSTGEVRWRWRIDSSIHATPSVDLSSQRLYINTEQWNEGSPTGHLQCLDWNSGRVLWKHRHGWWPPGSSVVNTSSGLVYAPCNDATLGAWDAATGALRWSVATTGLVRGRPAVCDDKVLVATERGYLHCWSADSGEKLWTVRYGKGLWHQFLQTTPRHVLLMDGKWHFLAFALNTGELAWLTRLRSPGTWMPVRCGRYLVILSRDGHLAVIDPEREVKVWEGSISGSYRQPPAIGQGRLVAASTTDGLMAFEIDPYYEH